MTAQEPNPDDLQAMVAELEAAVEELRMYGEHHEIPAIERNATRMAGTLEAVKQNIPGGLSE